MGRIRSARKEEKDKQRRRIRRGEGGGGCLDRGEGGREGDEKVTQFPLIYKFPRKKKFILFFTFKAVQWTKLIKLI
jgi:hypothetical protein